MAGEAGGAALGRAADKLFSLSGLFAVRKPKGPTSAAVLNLLKERLLAEAGVQTNGKNRNQVLKIGHGGTLDSAATGVLVVGIGKGTKMLGTMLAGSKVLHPTKGEEVNLIQWQKYTAIGMLGKATDTLDATGKVTEEKPYDQVTKGDLENVLQKFTGDIMQVPPLYSALKKDGERLSTLMKRGEAVEAKPARPVRVYSLSLQQFQPPLFTLDVECGGGFYVRSLVNDIGKELSTCATVQELTRTKQGPFTLEEHALQEDKWTIDEIAQSLELCTALLLAVKHAIFSPELSSRVRLGASFLLEKKLKLSGKKLCFRPHDYEKDSSLSRNQTAEQQCLAKSTSLRKHEIPSPIIPTQESIPKRRV
ncbi:putative tRNA pseudouridine synthase 1 [Turdus rufiventris]|nr:putative tRNA pseudouridine synthase 1 [Turdus rufiventris]